ncbi:hypothetical protein ABIE78_004405 [Sinorhizobium fredii]|uniref:Transmembrane protein n=1 Tax=Sinorhizobium fredii (strain USDA 257) TaxID=1185652 RepID=I3X1Q9_SINF2|nr:hypothetical protein [Sinorhizobium fredii]AFL49815.1 hypothetical protein USDA257_c12240 [Sinorhizobium fredii USDA 257]
MVLYLTAFASLLLSALSLGPSFAHVLEAPPRLTVWSPELWREATVFNGQFALFAKVGAPLDVGSILIAFLLTYLLANERPAFWFALGGAVLLAAGLAAWFTIVAPANAILATWKPGPIPPDFAAVRLRWEAGHMTVAAAKLIGFVFICVAFLAPRLPAGTN